MPAAWPALSPNLVMHTPRIPCTQLAEQVEPDEGDAGGPRSQDAPGRGRACCMLRVCNLDQHRRAAMFRVRRSLPPQPSRKPGARHVQVRGTWSQKTSGNRIAPPFNPSPKLSPPILFTLTCTYTQVSDWTIGDTVPAVEAGDCRGPAPYALILSPHALNPRLTHTSICTGPWSGPLATLYPLLQQAPQPRPALHPNLA